MSEEKLKCGVIMPISAIDGCSPEHWLEVKDIIFESVESVSDYNFSISLVSDAEGTSVIQKRIVQNVYSSDIVICDVSCKNPNVMFELGMRLAFDMPVVIIKDDKTNYSFDTGVIEHLEYPRNLRYKSIVEFKKDLAKKVSATYNNSYSKDGEDKFSYLKAFGEFKVAKLDQTEVPASQMIAEDLNNLKYKVDIIFNKLNKQSNQSIKSQKQDGENFIVDLMLIQYINEYLESKNKKLQEIIDDDYFYEWLIDKMDISPRKNFESKKEFINYIKNSIIRIYNSQKNDYINNMY